MIREIVDNNNHTIGRLSLPDGTSEEVWQEKLSAYKIQNAEQINRALTFSIKVRKEFAERLLEEFKFKNLSEGVNALQGMWIQHKMRALPVSFMGVNFTLDILNMAVSGDVEIACLALQNCELDDMTMPYHWFNSARRDWLVSEMKKFLGWS